MTEEISTPNDIQEKIELAEIFSKQYDIERDEWYLDETVKELLEIVQEEYEKVYNLYLKEKTKIDITSTNGYYTLYSDIEKDNR